MSDRTWNRRDAVRSLGLCTGVGVLTTVGERVRRIVCRCLGVSVWEAASRRMQSAAPVSCFRGDRLRT
jgi:hypothetical protein